MFIVDYDEKVRNSQWNRDAIVSWMASSTIHLKNREQKGFMCYDSAEQTATIFAVCNFSTVKKIVMKTTLL